MAEALGSVATGPLNSDGVLTEGELMMGGADGFSISISWEGWILVIKAK
jgi:hypothetical protein